VSGLERVYAGSLDCVHCGLCLTSCPTYQVTGRETSSPRGRVYLMRGAAEGRVDPAGLLAEEAHLCLGCRACETACPTNVPYGEMLEHTRAALQESGLREGLAARVERAVLRHVVAHRGRLRAAVGLAALAQRLGLMALAETLLPRALRDAPALLPRVPADRAPLPERMRDGATVIRWKADHTYDVLKQGTAKLVLHPLKLLAASYGLAANPVQRRGRP